MYNRRLIRNQGSWTTDRKGAVLLVVLVVIVMLSLAAYQYSGWMASEYKASQMALKQAQARALAESGIHYATALLSNPTAVSSNLNGNVYNSTAFQEQGSPESGRGRFSLVAPIDPSDPNYSSGGTSYRYGVIDECGKINLNALLSLDRSGNIAKQILMSLPNPTNADLDSLSDCILDWLDADEDPRTNGAESTYYSSLNPPYACKNGPLDSLEELLLVKGMTPQILFGNDKNRNGIIDPDEDDGTDPTSQLGWSAYLTVYSREQDFDSQNNPRIYLNDSDLGTLTDNLTTALGQDLANFIINYRQYGGSTASATQGRPMRGGRIARMDRTGRTSRATGSGSGQLRQISSLYDLIDSQVTIPGSGGGSGTVVQSPLSSKNLDSLNQLMPLLFDKTTVTRPGQTIPPRINVATASPAVLQALTVIGGNPSSSSSSGSGSSSSSSSSSSSPSAGGSTPSSSRQLTASDIQAMIANRPSLSSTDAPDPIYQTPTWLITKANLSVAKVKALDKYITSRSQVYRVQSVGYFPEGGPTARIEAIIDTNGGMPRLIYWRELTELGKGFNLQKSP
jgi:type II secretory pathway component PulK